MKREKIIPNIDIDKKKYVVLIYKMENIIFQIGLNYIKTNLATKDQQDDFLKNIETIKKKLRKKIVSAEKKELEELPNLENIKK